MRTRNRFIGGVLAASLFTQLTACGTLFYPDRRGQIEGRIDPAIAVLDAIPMETQLQAMNFRDYSYAHYAHQQTLDNHFGASLARYQSDRHALYDRLAAELERMRADGEIALIYRRHGVAPPDEAN